MKNQLLSLTFLLCSLIACTEKTEIEPEKTQEQIEIENEIERNNAIALKIKGTHALFASISRQPSIGEDLIDILSETCYSDFYDFCPLSLHGIEKVAEIRGQIFGEFFEAVCRQPEAYPILNKGAEKFLGKYDKDKIPDELNELTRAAAMPGFSNAMARRPVEKNLYLKILKDYFNYNYEEEEE